MENTAKIIGFLLGMALRFGTFFLGVYVCLIILGLV